MDDEILTLISLTPEWETAFRDIAREIQLAGDRRFDYALVNFTAYLNQLENAARGISLPPAIVPYDTFWLLRQDGKFLGYSTLRYELTPALKVEGGHIGYIIRPSERRKGYGTKILALTLQKARDRGLADVMVTCNRENTPSAKIIQKNGGQYDGEAISPRTGKPVSHYWIKL